MNTLLEYINSYGSVFAEFSWAMLLQSSILIAAVLLIDIAIRKKVRAVFRYCIWMLVLVKLVLPTTLSSPTGLGYWVAVDLPEIESVVNEPVRISPAPEQTNTSIQPTAEEMVFASSSNAGLSSPGPVPETGAGTEVSTVDSSQIISQSSAAVLNWQGIVFAGWLAVVIVICLLVLQRVRFVLSLIRQARQGSDLMLENLEYCRNRINLKTKVSLKVSPNATSPAVCGLFRPVILVPQNLTPDLGTSQLRTVLLHEIAHIKRGDLWVNMVQTLLQIVYFYNPLLWLANAMIRRVREQAVDETVQAAMGEKAREYPETLLNVARLAFKRPALSLRLIGVVESRSALKTRIKRMLTRPIPKSAKLGIASLVIVIVIGGVLLPMEASTPGTPGLVIKGTVADAVTGEPIAGVKVFDDGYANDPDWEKIESGYYEMNLPHWGDITDAKGNYAFLTYPEHHSFKIEATGYKTKRATLYSGHFTLNKKDVEIFDFKLEPVGSQKTNKFIKTLNNGVTIELVGICEHPSEGKQWWRPDGSTLSERPYNKKLEVLKNEGTAVEFFARAYSKTSEPFELDGFHIETAKEVGKAFKLENNFSPQGQTKASAAVLTEGSLYCDIEVGLWIGEWVTKAQTKGGEIISGKDRIYSFSEPVVLQDGGIKISLAHNPPDGVGISQRMILIDKQGLIHKSSKDKRSGTADLEQNEVVFHGVDMDNVQKFLFQTRPYEWVTFKNVSLKPGHKTDVQVEVENNKTTMKPEGEIFVAENYIADLPIAGKIELVSVCQFITDDREQKKLCWNPDGSKPEIPIYSR
ncbi:MAG: M56 family metallopeptidase, partial [Planctomycetota bacterium]